jgi:hypothetical protein
MTHAEKVKYRPQLLENARGMLADVEVQIEAIERMSEIVSTIQTAEVVDWIVGPSPIAETVGHRIQPAGVRRFQSRLPASLAYGWASFALQGLGRARASAPRQTYGS